MLIALSVSISMTLFLLFEEVYLRKFNNYTMGKYEGLVAISSTLADSVTELTETYSETLEEYKEFSDLVGKLLTTTDIDEANILSDKICVLINTGISRYYE